MWPSASVWLRAASTEGLPATEVDQLLPAPQRTGLAVVEVLSVAGLTPGQCLRLQGLQQHCCLCEPHEVWRCHWQQHSPCCPHSKPCSRHSGGSVPGSCIQSYCAFTCMFRGALIQNICNDCFPQLSSLNQQNVVAFIYSVQVSSCIAQQISHTHTKLKRRNPCPRRKPSTCQL